MSSPYHAGRIGDGVREKSGFLMSGSCSSCCCFALPFAGAVGRPRLGAMETRAPSRRQRVGSLRRAIEVRRAASKVSTSLGPTIHEYLNYS